MENEVLRFDYAEPHPIFYKYSERREQRQKGKWNFHKWSMPSRILYSTNIGIYFVIRNTPRRKK